MNEETDVLRVGGGTARPQLQSLRVKDATVGNNVVVEVNRGYCHWHADDICGGRGRYILIGNIKFITSL